MKTILLKRTFVCIFASLFVCNLYAYEKKVALIWGNANYGGQWESLPVVENDANTISNIFSSLGYRTMILLDGNLDQMKSCLKEFASLTKNADIAVFYYSGHATRINDSYYLVPAKTKLGNDMLASDLLQAQDILKVLNNSRLKLLFFDSCRDDATIEGTSKGNPNIISANDVGPDLSSDSYMPSGTMICYASERGKKAYTGSGSLSVFTKVLSEHLTDGDEFRTVWANIINDVYLIQKQRPVNDGFYQHDLYLNPSGRKHLAPSQKAESGNPQTLTKEKSISIVSNIPNSKIDFYGTIYDTGKPLVYEIGKTYIYTVTATGYKPYVGNLKVTDTTPSTIQVTLQKDERASLRITSNIKSSVSFDGKNIGSTPITVNTTSGTHSIILSADKYFDYSAKVDLDAGENTKHITLMRQKPFFFDWHDSDAPGGYISYLYSPKYQIGLQYLHRFDDTRFLLGANIAVSTGLFRGWSLADVSTSSSQSTSTTTTTIDDDGHSVTLHSTSSLSSYEPDSYSEKIDPQNEAKQYDSNFLFLITGGYQPFNGLVLEAGVGAASHCKKYYLPYSYSVKTTVITNMNTGEMVGEPKNEYVLSDGSTWIKEDVKWSPAMRIGMKINIPVGQDFFFNVGGGYTYAFSNSKCSSWDASVGVAWCY